MRSRHAAAALALLTPALLTLAAREAPADACRARATFKEVSRAAADPSAASAAAAAARTPGYDVRFEVEVSGCPDAPGRPGRFAKASYGTITYTFKKRFVRARAAAALVQRPDVEEKRTQNWNKPEREFSVDARVTVDDPNLAFEVTDVKVERVACGCR